MVALGWDLAALVFLYWFELGIISVSALVKALFAGRPSEFDSDPLIGGALASKGTAISMPFTDRGIQLSTLPVLAVAVPILVLVWFFVGVTTVGVIGSETPEPGALGLVVLSSFGIFLSEGASTLVEYFYRGGYRDHSAQTAIQGIFMRGAVIGVSGLLTATFVGIAAGSVSGDDSITSVDPTIIGPPILVGLVLVKFSFDLGSVLALIGLSLVVPLGRLMVDYRLRYGGIEFRVSAEAIVAYDRLFMTRLWRIETLDERGLRVERDRLHRWLDTSRIVIECADRELWIPHVHDPEPIVDVFDRRINGV